MFDCPTCKAPLAMKAVACNGCGWERPKETAANSNDPDWWRCCHDDRGQRCANAGSVSPGTAGTSKGNRHISGPWFCWQHVPAMQQFKEGEACLPPMGFDALRRKAGWRPPVAYDFEAEAERLALQQEAVL